MANQEMHALIPLIKTAVLRAAALHAVSLRKPALTNHHSSYINHQSTRLVVHEAENISQSRSTEGAGL